MIQTAQTQNPTTYPYVDDESLVRDIQQGNDAAFEYMVRKHSPKLLAVARRYMKNEQDAFDALQETFINVHKHITKFEGKSALNTWLHRIAVNNCLMKLRSKKQKAETSIDDLLPQYDETDHRIDHPLKDTLATEYQVESKATQTIIHSSINKLPDTYRNLLLLRDIEGYNTLETAKMLNMTEGAVKTGLHRARSALKTLLEPLMEQNAL